VDVSVTRSTAKKDRLRHCVALASADAAEQRKHRSYDDLQVGIAFHAQMLAA